MATPEQTETRVEETIEQQVRQEEQVEYEYEHLTPPEEGEEDQQVEQHQRVSELTQANQQLLAQLQGFERRFSQQDQLIRALAQERRGQRDDDDYDDQPAGRRQPTPDHNNEIEALKQHLARLEHQQREWQVGTTRERIESNIARSIEEVTNGKSGIISHDEVIAELGRNPRLSERQAADRVYKRRMSALAANNFALAKVRPKESPPPFPGAEHSARRPSWTPEAAPQTEEEWEGNIDQYLDKYMKGD